MSWGLPHLFLDTFWSYVIILIIIIVSVLISEIWNYYYYYHTLIYSSWCPHLVCSTYNYWCLNSYTSSSECRALNALTVIIATPTKNECPGYGIKLHPVVKLHFFIAITPKSTLFWNDSCFAIHYDERKKKKHSRILVKLNIENYIWLIVQRNHAKICIEKKRKKCLRNYIVILYTFQVWKICISKR